MRTFHICCIFIVLSLGNFVGGEPDDSKKYDDKHVEYNENEYKKVYELAKAFGKANKHTNYVDPYRWQDYAKLGYDVLPNRFKQKLIYYFTKFTIENDFKAGDAAFEAVRYATEDMMDVYQGRIHSAKEMAQFIEIRNTDPMRFMVAAAVHDHMWFSYAKKGDEPTFKVFRDFARKYYTNNPPKRRPVE